MTTSKGEHNLRGSVSFLIFKRDIILIISKYQVFNWLETGVRLIFESKLLSKTTYFNNIELLFILELVGSFAYLFEILGSFICPSYSVS